MLLPPQVLLHLAGTYTSLFRFRGKLSGQDNADLLTELPRKFVKSISDESMEVRRTFDAQTVASNSISITLLRVRVSRQLPILTIHLLYWPALMVHIRLVIRFPFKQQTLVTLDIQPLLLQIERQFKLII